MPVHGLAQPTQQGRVVPLLQGAVEALHLVVRRGEQLCRHHVADRVGREGADVAVRPVDVLQDAPGGVRGHES